MRQAVTFALGASAFLGALSLSPSMAEILIQSGDDDEEVHIVIDRESPAGRITREYFDGPEVAVDEENSHGRIIRMVIDDGNVVSTCVRLETEDGDDPLTCISDKDRSDYWDAHFADGLARGIEEDVRAALRDVQRELAAHQREFSDHWREQADQIRASAAEMADMAANIQEAVMTSLAESGLRMETDAHGNDVVWISNDDTNDPSLRAVSGADGRDLVFFYYDGFDHPYQYVIEDDDYMEDDGAIIHAFDVSTVEVIRGRDGNSNMDGSRDENGRPHLTVHTDHPERVHVVPLDRSQFDG